MRKPLCLATLFFVTPAGCGTTDRDEAREVFERGIAVLEPEGAQARLLARLRADLRRLEAAPASP